MKYDRILEEVLTVVTEYNGVKDNLESVQNIRDRLSIALVFFGEEFANLRADAEKAENDRKRCLEEEKENFRKSNPGRGSASAAESHATLACQDLFTRENEAKRLYYKSKELMERSDQLLNSISSRIKILMNEKD